MGLKKRGQVQFLPKGGYCERPRPSPIASFAHRVLRPYGPLINRPMFAEVPLIVLPSYPSFDLIMVARP